MDGLDGIYLSQQGTPEHLAVLKIALLIVKDLLRKKWSFFGLLGS